MFNFDVNKSLYIYTLNIFVNYLVQSVIINTNFNLQYSGEGEQKGLSNFSLHENHSML